MKISLVHLKRAFSFIRTASDLKIRGVNDVERTVVQQVLKFSLALLLFSSSLLTQAYTDDELRNLSLYDLEELTKTQIEKSQRKLVRTLLKSKTKATASCEVIREDYYSMPYQEFLRIGDSIQSKSKKKIYTRIAEIRAIHEVLLEENSPDFILEVDEFSGTMEFRTKFFNPVSLSKGDCPKLKGAYARASNVGRNFHSEKSSLKGQILEDGSSSLEINFKQTTRYTNASEQFFGIRGAISKSLGNRMKVSIDNFTSTTNGPFPIHFMDFSVSIDIDELETFYENDADEEFKIFSHDADFVMTLKKSTIRSFYDGLKGNEKILKHFYP
jgi:hypothetical protein